MTKNDKTRSPKDSALHSSLVIRLFLRPFGIRPLVIRSSSFAIRVRHSYHSARKAMIGSTRVARRAGSQAATNATAETSRTMATNVAGSDAPTPKKKAVQQAVAAKAPISPPPDYGHDRHGLTDDEAKDGAFCPHLTRCECRSHCALRNGIRHHAVNSDRREQQRRAGKNREQQGVEARPGQRAGRNSSKTRTRTSGML